MNQEYSAYETDQKAILACSQLHPDDHQPELLEPGASSKQSQTMGIEKLATEPAQPATGNAAESSASEQIPPIPTGTRGEPDAKVTAQPAAPENTASESTPCDNDVEIQDYPNRLPHLAGGEGRVTVDPSYRFGEFRKNIRSPNMGVEFLNSIGTPIVAAADGTVVVASTDNQIVYARNLNEYGNLIILEHQLTDFKDPVYTLYAHLSVNLASVSGLAGAVGMAAYAASKAGVVGFTKSLAREIAPSAITVNAIAPGINLTEQARHNFPPSTLVRNTTQVPLGRAG